MATSLTNMQARQKILDKYKTFDQFYASNEFKNLTPENQSKVTQYFWPLDAAKTQTQSQVFGNTEEKKFYETPWNEKKNYYDPSQAWSYYEKQWMDTSKMQEAAKTTASWIWGLSTEVKVPKAPEWASDDYYAGRSAWLAEWLSWIKTTLSDFQKSLSNVGSTVSDLTKWLWDLQSTTKRNMDFVNQKVDTKQKIMQDSINAQTDLFSRLESDTANRYKDAMDNIRKQAELIDSKYWDMRNNLSTIENNYKDIQEFNKAATSWALETTLRWKGWKSVAAKIANSIWQMNMQIDKNYKDLEIQTLDARNKLEQNYLALKDAVNKDQYSTAWDKLKMNEYITQQLQGISKDVEWKSTNLVDEAAAPMTQVMNAAQSLALTNALDKASIEWSMNPVKKDQIIMSIIQKWFWDVNMPKEAIEKAKNEQDMFKALLELSAEIKAANPTNTVAGTKATQLQTILSQLQK